MKPQKMPDLGCMDEEDLNETNCDLLWLMNLPAKPATETPA